MQPVIFGVLLLLCSCLESVSSARILAVFPHLGKSHFIYFEPLLLALAGRGHEVVVISSFPQEKPVPNYTDINIEPALTLPYKNNVGMKGFGTDDPIPSMYILTFLATFTCDKVLSYPAVQTLLQSDQKFDLVMYEPFNTYCFLGFAHKFKAPTIAMSSSLHMPWGSDPFGIPDNPAYIAIHFLALGSKINFYGRFRNLIYYFFTKLYFKLYSDIPCTDIARRYFGEDLPPLEDLAANTSLLLVNQHFSISQPRPYPPNVIEVPGLQMQSPTKLPADLEKYLSEAEHGVIYFSLGSTLRTSSMAEHVRKAFIEAFAELPQRILWKWEEDSMPGKPHNVKIEKWLPQMSILAHPNVKLFINHGGLMGILEAVHSGVPMVSLPMLGDQFTNIEHLVEKGVTVKLRYNEISKENILMAIREVLDDPSYRENAQKVSRIFHDRPQSSINTAMYWTEYVIRHRGAPHLRSAALDLNWFQYLLLDVWLVIFAVIIATIVLSVFIIRLIIKRLFGSHPKDSKKTKKQKSH